MVKIKNSYNATRICCYAGLFTQAISINLMPLLFVVFQSSFSLSREMLGRLVLINFVIQICVDLVAVKLQDRLSMRFQAVTAHIMVSAGLLALAFLPRVMSVPYIGLVIADVLFAVGGGLIEVVASPIVAQLPASNNKIAIPLLHSFYCWGHVSVGLLSTLYLFFAGLDSWYVLPILWAAIPLVNTAMFAVVPITSTVTRENRTPIRRLLKSKVFILAMVMMVCAGASEQAIAQWVSYFAELGLHMPKLVGDIVGLCAFALFMALVRMLYGVFGQRLDLRRTLCGAAALCIVSYLCICLVNIPAVSLAACAVCGIAVALMWPGTVSMTCEEFPLGGTALFGILAVMGDIGCSLGPWITGIVSDAAVRVQGLSSSVFFSGLEPEQIALKIGILAVIAFPVTLFCGLLYFCRKDKQRTKKGVEADDAPQAR